MSDSVNSVLKVIKDHLKERNIKLTEIAENLGSSHTTVSRILSGQTKLDLVDFEAFSKALGIPMSTMLREAEAKNSKVRISEEVEKRICSDPRRYAVFIALNDPLTIEGISARYGIAKKFVEQTIEFFEEEGIAFRPGQGLFQLTDLAKDIKFGRTPEFYEIKSRIYRLQALDTYNNLSRGDEYWADKDDQLQVARLSVSQALAVAKQIEAITQQVITMDDMNDLTKADGSRETDTRLHMVYLSLKPMQEELLKALIKGDKNG
jgi:transcriptional regulator with XRE-family HTH domain